MKDYQNLKSVFQLVISLISIGLIMFSSVMQDGTVEIIDHYPGGHSSIDVMSGDTLYKHLTLDDVLEHNKEG